MTLYFKPHQGLDSEIIKLKSYENLKTLALKCFLLPKRFLKPDMNNPHIEIKHLSKLLGYKEIILIEELKKLQVKKITIQDITFYSIKDYFKKIK